MDIWKAQNNYFIKLKYTKGCKLNSEFTGKMQAFFISQNFAEPNSKKGKGFMVL
jgi:hypothetical protein